ncbi:uncharacterized protein LOC120562742 isoform X2 [Perca fluviatilis]|uniref:uncharacterized protein LOC120562742 isoform X2 n=1 Tax=Perca fluviatilis TaxID=8168 RepID=UPI001965C687|nr:uncharacterized protein LOC120562742 isoform X2 [Perca fluviatilis]
MGEVKQRHSRRTMRMPPAKRGLLYRVQDVIEAIQNGERDLEMELDDTNASDEEADEHAGEVDKENQQPTDCPAGDHVDIEPQPNKLAAKYKFRTKSCHWYIYISWHTIILAVIAFLLCKALNISRKEILNRIQFQAQLASFLILVNATLNTPKRSRPSLAIGSPVTQMVTQGVL